MELFILVIFITLFFLLPASFIRNLKRSRKVTIRFSAVLGFLLVPITLFLLNQQQLVLPAQNEPIEWISKVGVSSYSKNYLLHLIQKNFVFIDISFSNQELELPGSNKLGSSTITVTDRKELTTLFTLLQKNESLTDLIICDIYFDVPAKQDSALRDVLTDQSIESKLILSHNFIDNIPLFESMNDSVFGNIVENGHEHSISTFIPYRHDYPSLSYLLFKKLQKVEIRRSFSGLLVQEKGKGHAKRYGLNSYLPAFLFTDEKALYHSESKGKEENEGLSVENYFQIGDVASSENGQFNLLATLQQRRKMGMKNIIFIGSFTGEHADVHPTYYGNLHGPTILLNLFLSLWTGQHYVSFWYLLYLWTAFTILFIILIRQAFGLSLFSRSQAIHEISSSHEHKGIKHFKNVGRSLWHIIILDELYFWMFAMFILTTAFFWGRIVNGLGLLILSRVIYRVLQYRNLHKV